MGIESFSILELDKKREPSMTVPVWDKAWSVGSFQGIGCKDSAQQTLHTPNSLTAPPVTHPTSNASLTAPHGTYPTSSTSPTAPPRIHPSSRASPPYQPQVQALQAPLSHTPQPRTAFLTKNTLARPRFWFAANSRTKFQMKDQRGKCERQHWCSIWGVG